MKRHRNIFIPRLADSLPRAVRWRLQAELLELSGAARLRLEWLIFHESVAKGDAAATARYFGISRKTFYKWAKRFARGSVRALEDQSRAPHTRRSWQPAPEVLERMLALRRQYPHWGKETLAAVYWSWYGERISPWQFQRLLERFHLPRPSRRRRVRRSPTAKQRISYALRKNARQLWQLDTVVLPIGPVRRYVVTALEHTTKLGFAHAYERGTSRAATDFLARLAWFTGAPPRVLLTDNGSEFAGRFEAACRREGMVRYYSRPRRPTDNPECERFNQTLQTEWLEGNATADLAALNDTLGEWLLVYNAIRPHHSLGLRTPLVVAQQTKLLSPKSPAATGAQQNLATRPAGGRRWS